MRIARLIRSRWLWLAGALLVSGGLIVVADRVWPLPLKEVNPARVVVDEQGVPLWRFADSEGIWRYPVTIKEVSPRYLEALIQYEDRWFWDHPGVNPLSVLRAAWQDLTSGRVVSGGLSRAAARLPCRWHAFWIRIREPLAVKFVSCGGRCSWSGISPSVKS